jgi:hypothetical protein
VLYRGSREAKDVFDINDIFILLETIALTGC